MLRFIFEPMVDELYDLQIFRVVVLVHEGGFEVLVRDSVGLALLVLGLEDARPLFELAEEERGLRG